MNQINFLPADFVEEQVRHHRIYREAVWVAVTLLAIGGWCVSSRGSLDSLGSYASALQQEAAAVREQVSEMTKLQLQQKTLLHQVRIQRELLQPLNTTAVLATISELMSPSMALTSLELTGTRPVPAPRPPNDPRTGEPLKVAPKPKPPQMLRLELVCLAPSDVDVANFVGRLSDHAMFTNVKMLYSRATVVSDLQAREFRIEMDVPLARDYSPASVQSKVQCPVSRVQSPAPSLRTPDSGLRTLDAGLPSGEVALAH
jgi:Tfp pilus assembly protein PilN